MKIIVDRNSCVGHARCHHVAPELIRLDENGYIAIDSVEVPAGQEALARRTTRACPEQALRMVEAASSDDVQP